MKTLRALAIATFFGGAGTTAQAAPPMPPASANFASERGMAFGLRLDGQPLTRPLARQVHAERLLPGQHWADFSLPTPYGPPMRFRTSVWLEPGLETSYVLILRPGFSPQLRQVGAVPMGGPGYGPGPGYDAGGYPSGPMGGAPGTGPGGYYGGSPAFPGNYPGNYPSNSPYGGNTAPDPAPGYPGGYGPGNAPAPGPGGYPGSPNGGYLQPLAPAEVQNLVQALRSQPFDDERLPIAKQALGQGLVRADELSQLIDAMTFDRARIDLAKYGYAHLSDPQNFYRVYGALRYASSIREVQQALGLPQN